MLDDDDGVAVITQLMEDAQQLADVVEVQAGGRLVEDVERLAGVALGQFPRQLDPLRLAAGEGDGILAEGDVAEADFHQRIQLAGNRRYRRKEGGGFLDGHGQHFVYGLALVADVEGFAVVALALADVAVDEDVRQKVHFHLDDAVAGTGLATAALDVEAEAARRIAA